MIPRKDFFESFSWKADRLELDDLVFVADEQTITGRADAQKALTLLKPKRMIDQYARFWSTHPDFDARHVLELGIHRGGGLAFWFELFRPGKLVGIEIKEEQSNPAFEHYLDRPSVRGRIVTHWRTSQTDGPRLAQIVSADFGGHLDLVIDDASHLYSYSKRSFETLFPLLRPGGFYIIEDWSWACWAGLNMLNPSMHPLAVSQACSQRKLTKLIMEISMATGTMDGYLKQEAGFLAFRPLIACVHLFADFVVVERGDATRDPLGTFSLPAVFSPRAELAKLVRMGRRLAVQAVTALRNR